LSRHRHAPLFTRIISSSASCTRSTSSAGSRSFSTTSVYGQRWPSGSRASRTRPRCDAAIQATRTCGSSIRTRARRGGCWGRTASCPAGSSGWSASLESVEGRQDARFGSSPSRSPSARPSRNSFDARPRDRASFGSCELRAGPDANCRGSEGSWKLEAPLGTGNGEGDHPPRRTRGESLERGLHAGRPPGRVWRC